MSMTPEDRRVITFYSFKGGVGRTMLLANLAYRMANKHGLRVIAVDWDLEAPGLHRFFGVSSRDAATKSGLLDYFEGWREAVARHDSEPPKVDPWIIPITDEKHAPRFGTLSLLTAGRMDEGYAGRLAALNWQEFYEKGAGASAVETLRQQLTGLADVVLIDSRTGFTDTGGICTIQIPDGVVLVTAPNQQSLEGIGRVTRAIVSSPSEARAERAKPRVWLVVSRMPMVEETYLAERWLVDNAAWFKAGAKEGLWSVEDHPEGLRSHAIPHRGRWALDEAVLNEASGADPGDLLSVPYDRLAETLLRWLRGDPPLILEAYQGVPEVNLGPKDLASLEAGVLNAERRGDIQGMALGLHDLGEGLLTVVRRAEAIRKFEQASGIFLSRGLRNEYLRSLAMLATTLGLEQRSEEAYQVLGRALEVARDLKAHNLELLLLGFLSETQFDGQLIHEAEKTIAEAFALLQTVDEKLLKNSEVYLISKTLAKVGDSQRAMEALRKAIRIARHNERTADEEWVIRSILGTFESRAVEGVAELRARLAELEEPAAQPVKSGKIRKNPK